MMPEVARNGRSNRTKVANRFVLVLVVVLVLGRAFHLRIDELPVIDFERGACAQPYQIEDEYDDEYEDESSNIGRDELLLIRSWHLLRYFAPERRSEN